MDDARLCISYPQTIAALREEVRDKERDLTLASQNLETVLISQEIVNRPSFEQKYYAVKRERDDLMLKCVQTQSDLESARLTIASAITSFTKRDTMETKEPSTFSQEGMDQVRNPTDQSGGVNDISSLLDDLTRKMQIELNDEGIEPPMLLEFLKNLHRHKENEKGTILSQLQLLTEDIEKVEEMVKTMPSAAPRNSRGRSTSSLGKRGREQMEDEDEERNERKRSKLFDSRFSQDLESSYFMTRTASSNSESALQTFSQHLSTVS